MIISVDTESMTCIITNNDGGIDKYSLVPFRPKQNRSRSRKQAQARKVKIKEMLDAGYSYKEVAKVFDISAEYARLIDKGER